MADDAQELPDVVSSLHRPRTGSTDPGPKRYFETANLQLTGNGSNGSFLTLSPAHESQNPAATISTFSRPRAPATVSLSLTLSTALQNTTNLHGVRARWMTHLYARL